MRRFFALWAISLLGCTSDPQPPPTSVRQDEQLLKSVPHLTEDERLIVEVLAAATPPQEAMSAEEADVGARYIDRMLLLTVDVKAADGTITQKCGSAVIVGKDGTALTAFHVVKEAEAVRATPLKWKNPASAGAHAYERGAEFAVTVVRTSAKSDVALIRPSSPQQLSAPLRVQRMLPGTDERVYHLGITSDVADGNVRNAHSTSMVPNAVVREVIEVETATNPGDSGGPLLNENGDVVGICLAFSTNKRGFFLPTRTALESLRYSPPR